MIEVVARGVSLGSAIRAGTATFTVRAPVGTVVKSAAGVMTSLGAAVAGAAGPVVGAVATWGTASSAATFTPASSFLLSIDGRIHRFGANRAQSGADGAMTGFISHALPAALDLETFAWSLTFYFAEAGDK